MHRLPVCMSPPLQIRGRWRRTMELVHRTGIVLLDGRPGRIAIFSPARPSTLAAPCSGRVHDRLPGQLQVAEGGGAHRLGPCIPTPTTQTLLEKNAQDRIAPREPTGCLVVEHLYPLLGVPDAPAFSLRPFELGSPRTTLVSHLARVGGRRRAQPREQPRKIRPTGLMPDLRHEGARRPGLSRSSPTGASPTNDNLILHNLLQDRRQSPVQIAYCASPNRSHGIVASPTPFAHGRPTAAPGAPLPARRREIGFESRVGKPRLPSVRLRYDPFSGVGGPVSNESLLSSGTSPTPENGSVRSDTKSVLRRWGVARSEGKAAGAVLKGAGDQGGSAPSIWARSRPAQKNVPGRFPPGGVRAGRTSGRYCR